MMHWLLAILLAVTTVQLDEVEVTARRAQVQSEAFRQVTILRQEEIAALPVSNIADILQHLPCLDVRTRGASDAQSDVSLRGGTFDQVLILLNGVPVSDPQTGHYNMNIPIATALIDRIEVLQGTATHVTGAFSGAINIVTREAEQDQYTLQLSGGTNSYVKPVFAASWVRDQVHVNTSVEYTRSDGYTAPKANEKEQTALENTDYRMADCYIQAHWKGLDIQAGAQYKDIGMGTGYGFASTDQFDATRTLLVSAGYNNYIAPRWALDAQAAYRGQYDRYEWHRGEPTNRHWTHNTHAALHAHYTFPIGRTSFGAEYKNEYIRSTNMGEHQRSQMTLNAEQQLIWKGLAASVGAAAHYNTRFGCYGSGAANIGYSFLRTGSVYITASRSLRMPTWTDLYYKAGVQRGNTHLKAEKAWLLSAGAHYTWNWEQAGSLHIAGDAYYRWGTDIIDWNYDENDRLYHATNQNTVNSFGLDITAQYRYNSWLRQISIRYAYTDLSLDMSKVKSNYLNYMRHKVTATIDHGIYVWSKGAIGAAWSVRWQEREGTYVDIYGKAGNAFLPVLLLDGNIYMECAHVRVGLECTNITNRHYYDYGGILQPGAAGRITVTAQL